MLKICFFGMGSIGKRHLKNLVKILKERKLDFEIDVVKRKKEVDEEVRFYIKSIYSIKDFIPTFYDIVFIVNDTSAHIETLNLMKNYSNNFFIEKPLSINISKINIDDYKGKKIYIACPMRYSNVIEYLKKEIDFSKVYSIRALCSSYLPDWRPTIDYRNNYSAKKELGGGVTLDLIHEWDYLTYLLGFPEKIFNLRKKVSHLEISSDDISVYIAEYKDKLVELHLDYFGRVPTRRIELFLKEGTVIGDFIKNTVILENNKEVDLSDDVDDYIKEMNNFLDIIFKGKVNFNNLEYAYKVLKLIEGE
ncbi:Gfo/Idh/MocA family protein [Fusobacterium animalis]|uniref:Gfo/Idh/MocA family protein n=1 Tax=Fusobacterium animalis TaxID=76859 RepID=UPI0030CDAF4D